MANYTLFTHPMSRGQIARWALHETGADYEQVIIDWANKPAALFAANPMGKIPTLIHDSLHGDKVVSEAAAICHYLAEMHPEAGLLPKDREMADYFRWMFFAAGPVEAGVTTHALGLRVPPDRERMAGWGTFERMISTLEWWFEHHAFVCGDRFTMADVYVGSQIDWGLTIGSIPANKAFVTYAERFQSRPAYTAAKAINNALIAEMQK